MEVIFLNSFKKDLKKINDKSLKLKVKDLIINLESASTLYEVENVIRMKGFNISFRVKVDNYRLGLYSSGAEIELARFVKRNDIYKVFPDKKKDK